jgi:hypothetical protein
MDPLNLQEIEKASRGVFNEDGLLYIAIGLLLLVVGLSFLFRPLLILVAFGALLVIPLEAVRRVTTYPRLGYAKFSAPPGTARGIALFAVVVIIILGAIALLGGGRFQQVLPLAYSIVFALAFYFGMSTQGLGRADKLLILVVLLTGLLTSLYFPDWHNSTAVLFTITGLFFIFFGLLKLLHFLHTTPLLNQEGIE